VLAKRTKVVYQDFSERGARDCPAWANRGKKRPEPAAANRRRRTGLTETEDTGVGGRQRQTGAGAQGLPKQGAQASGSGRHQAAAGIRH